LRHRDDPIDQGPAETAAARGGRDVQALHLAAAGGLQRPQRDAAERPARRIASEQDLAEGWRIVARQTGELGGEVLIGEVDVERGGIGREESGRSLEVRGAGGGCDGERGLAHPIGGLPPQSMML
jgi:hypothetical protein